MNQVLITGATGFIGGHLVDRFLADGYMVRAIVKPGNPDAKKLEQKGAKVVHGDVREYTNVARVMSDVNIVVHCAAVVSDWATKQEFEEVTVGGTRNICQAASKENVQRVIYLSTNDVFGLSEKTIFDESSPRKTWGESYPDYKIKAEEICWLFHKEQRLPITVLYPCWVYGKNDYTFTANLADAVVKKEMMFWREDATVWPTYIDNLTDLVMVAAEDDRAIGKGYLVHDGISSSLQEVSRRIAEALEVPPITTRIPYFVAYAYAKLQERTYKILRRKNRPLLTTYIVKSLGSRLRFSIARARIDLNWRPKTTFDVGFKRTMEWLKTVDRNQLKTK